MSFAETMHRVSCYATRAGLLWLLILLTGISAAKDSAYLGFDRNDYPGDANLKILRQTFSFAGYWLNVPPGEKRNTWIGKRRAVGEAGFGFLVLFNGRLYAELKTVAKAGRMGAADARTAIVAAKREGFPAGTILFLDQEQGGRMLPEQKAYIYAWVDGVTASGFRAGVYCSGIAAQEDGGESIVTANDIRDHAAGRAISYFVTNDACPPSPGCAFPRQPPNPDGSGISFAEAWQFAQSPKRPEVASACKADYNHDGQCYSPGGEKRQLFLDVDTAASSDPSHGRSR